MNDKLNNQYKFNDKEQDRETGYYYYGARYYNPRVSLWLNVDPLAEKYPSISPYVYCHKNPINAIDPDGRIIIFVNGQHAGDGGSPEYWNGLDQLIANRFQDYHARYYDGAMGGWRNSVGTGLFHVVGGFNQSNLWHYVRRREGRIKGYHQESEIYANLKDGETIKIATHSMGTAYGKGFVKGLKKYAKENGLDPRIERVLDLASYQGNKLETEKGIFNEQIAHTNDGTAGVSRIQGLDDNNFHETRQDKTVSWYDVVSEHSVDSFTRQEINKYVKAGSSSTAQPVPNKKIIVDYQQHK